MNPAEPAWFSALAEPLGEAECAEIEAYLSALAFRAPTRAVRSWHEALEICARPAHDPADPEWLSLADALHGARGELRRL